MSKNTLKLNISEIARSELQRSAMITRDRTIQIKPTSYAVIDTRKSAADTVLMEVLDPRRTARRIQQRTMVMENLFEEL